MIPAEIDVEAIVADLNAWGWPNQKIEIICGFSNGYILKIKSGARPMRPYQYCARLYNFWEEVSAGRELSRVANTSRASSAEA